MAKILIVDDDPILIEMYQERLAYEGHEVAMAPNGEAALDLVQSFLPDLILLDIIMPRMNGLETANFLQADPKTANIPIIFFTQLPGTPFDGAGTQFLVAPAIIFKRDHTPQTLAEFVNQYLHNQTNQKKTKSPDDSVGDSDRSIGKAKEEVYASSYY